VGCSLALASTLRSRSHVIVSTSTFLRLGVAESNSTAVQWTYVAESIPLLCSGRMWPENSASGVNAQGSKELMVLSIDCSLVLHVA
jgi:hypothetical protein